MLISMYVGEVLVVEFQQDALTCVHISFIRLLTCVIVSFDDWLRSIRNHTTAPLCCCAPLRGFYGPLC